MNLWDALLNDVVPLLVAAILGGVVGIEREIRGHWAGLRTHMMVSMGSAMFVIAGATTFKDVPVDVTRIIQGVATGVGFIGAGTIVKLENRLVVKGLTSASSIWLASGVGIAAGLQHYVLGVSGTLISLGVLSALLPFERSVLNGSNQEQHESES